MLYFAPDVASEAEAEEPLLTAAAMPETGAKTAVGGGQKPAAPRTVETPTASLAGAAAPARDGGKNNNSTPAPPTSEQNAARAALLRALQTGEPAARLAAAEQLLVAGASGPAATRALDVMMQLDPEAAVAKLRELCAGEGATASSFEGGGAALRKMVKREVEVTTEDLQLFYASGAEDLRFAAAEALEERGNDSYVRQLLADPAAALAEQDEAVRLKALQDISAFQGPAARELVIEALSDKSERVRLQAVHGLARRTDDESGTEELTALLEDPSEAVRQAAQRQLPRMERTRPGAGQRAPGRNAGGARRDGGTAGAAGGAGNGGNARNGRNAGTAGNGGNARNGRNAGNRNKGGNAGNGGNTGDGGDG